MISESMLRNAAKKSYEIHVDQLVDGYDPKIQHEFSPRFEKRIRKLKSKARHPLLHRVPQLVASIILVILIAGCSWITMDSGARAAFLGWVKEVYETYFVYKFEGNIDENDYSAHYRPTWLPDGYMQYYVEQVDTTTIVLYKNSDGLILKFQYAYKPDKTDWFLDARQATIKDTTVNGDPAEILIAENTSDANVILWTNEDNSAFFVSAFLSEADLIKVAESVQQKN